MAEAWRVGSDFRCRLRRLRWRSANGRFDLDPRSPAWCQRQKGGLETTPTAARDRAHARCMGRSRGGLTTKIHALVDANGRPIALKLSEVQGHDGRSAADMFETVEAGHILLADRAYDSDGLRAEMAE